LLTTYVVSPELMAAMEREQVHVPELPPTDDEVGAFHVLWAVEGEEGRFRVVETVTRHPLLREHLRLSAVEHPELHLRMGRYCCPVHSLRNANECT
jgi:hypothetical protein